MDSMTPHPIIVGITGASGSVLGFRLVAELLRLNHPVELVMTEKSAMVVATEIGLKLGASPTSHSKSQAIVAHLGLPDNCTSLLSVHGNQRLDAPPSSGTHLTRGMVVIPCSMGTLGRIANGISDNLVCRAADVTLKEGRKLILVPRETPLNAIHLNNMLTLSRLGVVMIPPMLSFYLPVFTQSVDGQIDYTLGKILDQLGLTHTLHERWGKQYQG
jgi:flavin prenyltransferase